MINPNTTDTIRVGELPNEDFSLSDKIPHEVGIDLKSGTVQQLVDLVANVLNTTDAVGFRAVTVLDGQTLPSVTPNKNEFILVGKGTFSNVGGGAAITTTEELNALVTSGTTWSIGVEIPIDVEANGIVQTIRDGFTETTPSENAVFYALSLKSNLASPAFTGTPTAPTATAGTNTTQVATTAFVTSAISTADSGNVKLAGIQTITGGKTFTGGGVFNTGGLIVNSFISVNADGVGSQGIRFSGNADNVGNITTVTLMRKNDKLAIMANDNGGTQKFAILDGSSLSSFDRTFSFPNQSGTFALTSNPTSITATSFIKSSAPTTNLLLAGGGDIAQSTFLVAPTGLTTNYLPKWNGSGFADSQLMQIGANIGIGNTTPNSKLDVRGGNRGNVVNYDSSIASFKGADQGIFTGVFNGTPDYGSWIQSTREGFDVPFNLYIQPNGGNTLFGTTTDNGVDKVQVNGTISASPATASNQVVVKSQLDAAARPYKAYTALISQTGTNAPVATVLENTLGGTVVWSYIGNGEYRGTLTSSFTNNKTSVLLSSGQIPSVLQGTRTTDNYVTIKSNNSSFVSSNDLLNNSTIEIRVYN